MFGTKKEHLVIPRTKIVAETKQKRNGKWIVAADNVESRTYTRKTLFLFYDCSINRVNEKPTLYVWHSFRRNDVEILVTERCRRRAKKYRTNSSKLWAKWVKTISCDIHFRADVKGSNRIAVFVFVGTKDSASFGLWKIYNREETIF